MSNLPPPGPQPGVAPRDYIPLIYRAAVDVLERYGRLYLVSQAGRQWTDPTELVSVEARRPAMMVNHNWAIVATTITGAKVYLASLDAPLATITPAGERWAEEQLAVVVHAIAVAKGTVPA